MGMIEMYRRGDVGRPKLLMLSHCVPDPAGGCARARAWQLLRLASQSHRVYLTCMTDGPVSLDQWRAIRGCVEGLAMERVEEGLLSVGHWRRLLRLSGGERAGFDGVMGGSVRRWLRQNEFDAVLCTEPGLLRVIKDLQIGVRVCDLQNHQQVFEQGIASGVDRCGGVQWGRRQVEPVGSADREFDNVCDVLTISSSQLLLFGGRCRVVVLPEAVDVRYLSRCSDHVQERGCVDEECNQVVFHTDWANDSCSQMFERFVRKAWPLIQRAVPKARLHHTISQAQGGIRRLFRGCFRGFRGFRGRGFRASGGGGVVVCGGVEPQPILQALALSQAVVAPRDIGLALGLRQAQEAILWRRESDWPGLCIELLQSESMRARLAEQGRALVEHRHSIEQVGTEIGRILGQASTAGKGLSKAA